MNYTKPVDMINVSEEEYRDFIENNIVDFKEFRKCLTNIEKDIEFKLLDNTSELKKEFDKLLENNFVYIKNKDIYYCNELNGLFPNFETFKFGKCHTYLPFDEARLKLKFNDYQGRLINKKEKNYIYKFKQEKPLKKKFSTNDISYFEKNQYYWGEDNFF